MSLLRAFLVSVVLVAASAALYAQEAPRYYRLYLTDKGTPQRFLQPGDPSYSDAVAHLTPRALARRAKTLPAERLVSTADLPVYAPYLSAIRSAGAEVLESSRWMNSVMIRVDSVTLARVMALPILDSISMMRADREPEPFTRKLVNAVPFPPTHQLLLLPSASSYCIVDHYGRSSGQNTMVQYDFANRLGIAGEGVVIGVCDAGFDWREHVAFRHLDVQGEYDFVNNDTATYDQPEENSPNAEQHGTMVLSLMTAYWPDTIVGAAYRSGVLLAKTEDIRSERHIEEDYLVAGLEWIEAQGGDVVNISLGYTTFDAPERAHAYSELNGHTAFASRGINHLVGLGVVAVVAAGNEGAASYRYISVPAEADSAIAAAAVDSKEAIAGFSSRGFGSPEAGGPVRIKPDLAALGVGNYAAVPAAPHAFTFQQGTSFASPVTATGVALLLSAAPELRPWEVRELLTTTASRASNPDTAFGYGIVRLGDAFLRLSRTRPIIGFPQVRVAEQALVIAAGTLYSPAVLSRPNTGGNIDSLTYIGLRIRNLENDQTETRIVAQPMSGTAHWVVRRQKAHMFHNAFVVADGDSIEIEIYSLADNKILRAARMKVTGSTVEPNGTGCGDLFAVASSQGSASPNPFTGSTRIEYLLTGDARVSLIIYNSIGEEVARLVDNETRGEGYHSEIFSPDGLLPAGAYYYRLSTEAPMYSSDSDAALDNVSQTGSLIYLP